MAKVKETAATDETQVSEEAQPSKLKELVDVAEKESKRLAQKRRSLKTESAEPVAELTLDQQKTLADKVPGARAQVLFHKSWKRYMAGDLVTVELKWAVAFQGKVATVKRYVAEVRYQDNTTEWLPILQALEKVQAGDAHLVG